MTAPPLSATGFLSLWSGRTRNHHACSLKGTFSLIRWEFHAHIPCIFIVTIPIPLPQLLLDLPPLPSTLSQFHVLFLFFNDPQSPICATHILHILMGYRPSTGGVIKLPGPSLFPKCLHFFSNTTCSQLLGASVLWLLCKTQQCRPLPLFLSSLSHLSFDNNLYFHCSVSFP